MSNSQITLKEVRNLTIKGIFWQFFPIIFAGLITPFLESIAFPEVAILLLIYTPAIISLFSGYVICCDAADRYAQYKGYKNYLLIYSILNIFGLSILFLLKNKKLSNNIVANKEPLSNFSISSIFISFIAIPVSLLPLRFLMRLYIYGTIAFEEDVLDNARIEVITNILFLIILIWYFLRELKRANLNHRYILGSLKRIDFKLPFILAILKYLLSGGTNSLILYCWSFILPQYVEQQINREYFTTYIEWIGYAIGSLIVAPILEEFLFRGIIFQKLALTKGVVKALLISALAFTLLHFRYDVIPLFITGLLYVILYLKTKQLAVPILCHFFYNLMVFTRKLYYQFFSGVSLTEQISITEYQQQFLDNWQLSILFIALSAPYLCYFIYKNFPRNYDLNKLPYFANQQTSND